MFDVLCMTNRMLCTDDFLSRIRQLAAAHPAGILLREKDLTEEAYSALASQVLSICAETQTRCILHTFVQVADALGCRAMHLPLSALRALSDPQRAAYSVLGASCHSVAEAVEAEQLGCTYVLAGHIFDTDCKKGLPGRGLDFLARVCESVAIPVYAIGGIRPERMADVRRAGAAGACVMSGAMRCRDAASYLAGMRSV